MSNSAEVKVKLEQNDNDMAQIKDAMAIQHKETDRRHKELLDVLLKLAQEMKVAPAYQQRTLNNSSSSYQPRPTPAVGQSRGPRDIEAVMRDIIC